MNEIRPFDAMSNRTETIKLIIVQPSSADFEDIVKQVRARVAAMMPDTLTINVRMSAKDEWHDLDVYNL